VNAHFVERPGDSKRARGQALAEFAIVFPILFLLIAGIIQFGVIFWGQNTLTQVARDVGRWASTQTTCPTTANVLPTANAIAGQSSLLGYATNAWTAGNVQVAITGQITPCPVVNNQQVQYVDITINHQLPVFFPWLPGDGNIATSAQFRMEPRP
jgi:Flp pilus assembly protein TadG